MEPCEGGSGEGLWLIPVRLAPESLSFRALGARGLSAGLVTRRRSKRQDGADAGKTQG